MLSRTQLRSIYGRFRSTAYSKYRVVFTRGDFPKSCFRTPVEEAGEPGDVDQAAPLLEVMAADPPGVDYLPAATAQAGLAAAVDGYSPMAPGVQASTSPISTG